MTSTETPERAAARAALERLWPVYRNTYDGCGIRGAPGLDELQDLRVEMAGHLALLGGEARLADGTPLSLSLSVLNGAEADRAARERGLARYRRFMASRRGVADGNR